MYNSEAAAIVRLQAGVLVRRKGRGSGRGGCVCEGDKYVDVPEDARVQ